MSLDHSDEWIRYSNNEARRKTEYEKLLESKAAKLNIELFKTKTRLSISQSFNKFLLIWILISIIFNLYRILK